MTDEPVDARTLSPAAYEAAKAALCRPPPQGVWKPPAPSPLAGLSEAEIAQRLAAARRGYILPPLKTT